jgi:predicted ATPase
LGVPLMAIKGYAAPEVEKVYARARELCQPIGNTAALTQALFGLCQIAFSRAEYKTAYELGEQLLSLQQTLQDPLLLAPLHALLGESLFLQGELSAASRELERGLSFYTPRRYHSAACPAGHDPGVQNLAILALALWYLGCPDQAAMRIHEALTLAHELSHPFSLAFALGIRARLSQLQGEPQRAQEQAERLIALSSEQGFPLRAALGLILRGWALAGQGQGETGVAQIRQGLAAWRATGTGLGQVMYTSRGHELRFFKKLKA